MVCVVPRGVRDTRVRFWAMWGPGRFAGVRCIEAGVELDDVIGVTLQSSKAVVVSVGERVRQHRVGADLDEGRVSLSGGCDSMGESHRVAQIVAPVVGVEGCRIVSARRRGDDRNLRPRRSQTGQL